MDKFIEASKRERFALMNILPLLKSNTNYDWTEYLTDIYSYDVYDCLLQAYIDGSIKKRFIIEIKIRDKHYDDLILETKKLKDLKSKVYDDITDVIYINVTPKGTYLFNVTKLQKENKLTTNKLMANKATMNSREHKIEKSVIYLDYNDAKFYPYTFSELQYKLSLNQIKKENNKHKQSFCLFEYIIKNS